MTDTDCMIACDNVILTVKIPPMVGPMWCRVMLIVIRIGLSHCCIMGLVSWSCGLAYLSCVMSHYVLPLATAFIDAWGCTSMLLCSRLTDWMYVCVDAEVMGPLCQRMIH